MENTASCEIQLKKTKKERKQNKNELGRFSQSSQPCDHKRRAVRQAKNTPEIKQSELHQTKQNLGVRTALCCPADDDEKTKWLTQTRMNASEIRSITIRHK